MTRQPLTAEDARILALESGNVCGHTCKVIVLDGVRSAGEVQAHVGERLDAVPRLRMRLDPDPGPPAWQDDPGFDLAHHVVGREETDDAGLRRLVGETMATPLDRERPLWQMEVVSPLPGKRTAIVWRIHHALADGMASMRMARALLFEPVEETAPPATAKAPAARLPSAGSVTRALRRELRGGGTRSPLDRPAGPRRQVDFVDAPLEQLRKIGHAAPGRATINDVVLAAVGGGLRNWLGALGVAAGHLRVKVPVSLHSRDDDEANRDSFMVVDLPLEHTEPLERLAAIAEETRERKRRHDAQALDVFFRDLSHLSRSLERQAEHWAMSPRVFTLNVSNVPGPRGAQLVLGAPLLELHSLAEIAHHHALRVAVVSAAGRISFGLCADADAVDGLDLIAAGIAREIEELAEAVA